MEINILPEFQKFLLSRGFAPPKNVPFYASWVSKFIAFSNRQEELNHDLLFEKFLDKLKPQKNTADWQIKQAEGNVVLIVILDPHPPTPLWRDKALAGQIGRAC